MKSPPPSPAACAIDLSEAKHGPHGCHGASLPGKANRVGQGARFSAEPKWRVTLVVAGLVSATSAGRNVLFSEGLNMFKGIQSYGIPPRFKLSNGFETSIWTFWFTKMMKPSGNRWRFAVWVIKPGNRTSPTCSHLSILSLYLSHVWPDMIAGYCWDDLKIIPPVSSEFSTSVHCFPYQQVFHSSKSIHSQIYCVNMW